MLKNPRILIYDDGCFGYVGSCEISAGRDLSEKDFKKWFNHVWKRLAPNDSAYAISDDKDGDGFHEWSNYWANLEADHNPLFPFRG